LDRKDGGASPCADADITQARVVIDDIEFQIFIPKPKPGSAGARARKEVLIVERCGFESCNRVIGVGGSTKRFCDDTCRNAHHNLLRKFVDLATNHN
jgi:hypothetical protein